jgi:hypothetical protein
MRARLLILTLVLWLNACTSSKADPEDASAEPPESIIDTNDTTAEDLTSLEVDERCLACPGIVGMAFRFSSMVVTEPDAGAIKDYLNEMWRRDIANELLNIVMLVTSYDPISGQMKVTVGSAMRFDDQRFHFICGTTGDYELRATPGSCDYANEIGPETLNFHTGPIDAPVYCAPELGTPNAIPVRGLTTKLSLKTDCASGTASVSAGFLEGWIPDADADRICFCNLYDLNRGVYTCEHVPQPESTYYCPAHCGGGNMLFGSVLKVTAKIAPEPDPFEGALAFHIAGYYDAESIPDFEPGCCASAAECPPGR